MAGPRRTLLHATHLAAGGRMVDFSGWSMPVQYRGILDEHRAVRERCGVFDISHMGEFIVQGPGALAWLNGMFTNDVLALAIHEGQYTLMLNDAGGVIDDLIVYRTGEEKFFLVVNAAKIQEDAEWLRRRLPPGSAGVDFADESGEFVALAIQGPDAPHIFSEVFAGSEMPPRNHLAQFSLPCGKGFVGVTGYTGEPGFEIFLRTRSESAAAQLWQMFVDAGAGPCGLGARDTLRLEMCYPLNGADLSAGRTPLEAGLGFFVFLDKGDFCGREALIEQKRKGLPSRLFALQLEGKGPPPRSHYPVLLDGEVVGETSSGALSPSLGAGIAMAYLPSWLKVGAALELEIRGRKIPARIVTKPFYKKKLI